MPISVHVCYGISAGNSLFASGFKPILAFGHTFDGRFQDFKAYENYEAVSQQSLQEIYQYYRGIDGFNAERAPLFYYKKTQGAIISPTGNEFLNVIKQCDEVIVWLSLGFQEQLLLALLIRFFTLYALPLGKIRVQRLETYLFNGKLENVTSIAMIPPKGLKEASTPFSLQQSEIELLTQGWEAITSSSLEKREAYLGLPSTTRFQEGLKHFQCRIPSPHTGLNHCQTELLKAYPLGQTSVNVNWLVGTVMAKNHNNSLDFFWEGYVIWNLMHMTNLHTPRPAFKIINPYTKEHQTSLTDFGQTLREGKANWLDENPVDYYIGGFHIHSTPPSPGDAAPDCGLV